MFTFWRVKYDCILFWHMELSSNWSTTYLAWVKGWIVLNKVLKVNDGFKSLNKPNACNLKFWIMCVQNRFGCGTQKWLKLLFYRNFAKLRTNRCSYTLFWASLYLTSSMISLSCNLHYILFNLIVFSCLDGHMSFNL